MSRSAALWLLAVALLVSAADVAAQSPPDVQDLIAKLKDKDESVRLKAAKELGKLKEKAKDAIPALTVAANRDDDEDVRTVAKKALETIKDTIALADKDKLREVLDPLVKDLKGRNAEKRLAALDKLSELGSQARDAGAEVVEFGILNAPASIREAATATLERIDPEAHRLIMTLILDRDETNRQQAIQGLEALGRKGKSGMPALKYHYLQLTTNDQFGGGSAGLSLHAMTKIAPDDKGVIDVVCGLVSRPVPIQRTSNLPERSLAIGLLAELKMDSKKKVAVLCSALNDADCRAQAATELGKLGPDAKDAVPLLTKLKLDPDKEVRDVAAAALDQIKP
jgi:hypothetical protein